MKKFFEGFDLTDFFDDREYALKSYVGETPSDEEISSVEKELGYKLPASYIELIKIHNGGIPKNTCFPTKTRTSWSDNHIAITGLYGISRNKPYSICGSHFFIDQWGYPDIGVCICDCPSGGHDIVMLDYRKCGPAGEPEVVHVDQDFDYQITFLAKDFESFIRGLVNESVYDTSEQDRKDALEKVENGQFSTLLSELIRAHQNVDFGSIIRKICKEIMNKKGYFALHADDLSVLIYDIQFYLYTTSGKTASRDEYLEVYPQMIALSDGSFSTHGYAPDFVSEWLDGRIASGFIDTTNPEELRFTPHFENQLMDKLRGRF